MVTTERTWSLIVKGKDEGIHCGTLTRCVIGKDTIYTLHLAKVDDIVLTIREHIRELQLKRAPVHITGMVIVIDLSIKVLVDIQDFVH